MAGGLKYRHVRIDDDKPRQGHLDTAEAYRLYCAGKCSCNHPGAHPPCGGCTSGLDEDEFMLEFEQRIAEGMTRKQALRDIKDCWYDY